MSESKISCPHCGQHILADDAWAGQNINCPACQKAFDVPAPAAPPPPPGLRINRPPAPPPGPQPQASSGTRFTGPAAAPPTAQRTSGLAIASLVLSFFGCLAIGGVICGHLARKQMRRDPSLGGRGLATAGLIIGYISVALTLALGIFMGAAFVTGFREARDRANDFDTGGRSGGVTWTEPDATTESPGKQKPAVPEGAVAGNIKGQPFNYSKATLAKNMSMFTLSEGEDFFADQEVKIFLFAKREESLENRTWKISTTSTGMRPHVHLTWQENGNRRTEIVTTGYEMELKTGAIADGVITGTLNLKVTGKTPAELNGKFSAVVE